LLWPIILAIGGLSLAYLGGWVGVRYLEGWPQQADAALAPSQRASAALMIGGLAIAASGVVWLGAWLVSKLAG
jgi:hypothetical protein